MKIEEIHIESTIIKFFDDYVEPNNQKNLNRAITETMMKIIENSRKEVDHN